jgi:hypothetical protein
VFDYATTENRTPSYVALVNFYDIKVIALGRLIRENADSFWKILSTCVDVSEVAEMVSQRDTREDLLYESYVSFS